ncbi:MFS transporter [Paraburkholderia sp. A2WS-5]|uniref:MFS transporter n=1 Tax=unclassified Paraburkholderia TaxID=2615204 RepID=UPI003B7824BE
MLMRLHYRATLERRASLVVAAALLGVLYAGSTLVTPLYPLYQRAFGLADLTATLIYATYVIGNLGALLFFGGVSDQAGRRRVSLAVLAMAGLSTVLFLCAVDPVLLFVARAASGLGIGVGAATATAWIAELHPSADKAGASRLAAAVNLAGLAAGVLISGLLARFAPWPLHTVFVVYLLALAGMGAWVAHACETVQRKHERALQGASPAALKPRIAVPRALWGAFVAPAVTAFATFALLGFYAALLPNLLARDLHLGSPAWSGLVIAELFAAGALTVVLAPRFAAHVAMSAGLWLLLPSLAMLLWAQAAASLALLVAATALCGVATALGFRGSLQQANLIAPASQRAGLLAAWLLCCYSGNALPVVCISLFALRIGPLWANVAFAAFAAVLALAALAVGARQRRSR